MKIVGIIPSRYESSRFPGKPLIDLAGKTMIQRVYEGASKSQRLNQVIVATDDQRIYDEVTSFGGEVMMTSESNRNGTERCAEVAAQIDADVVINIQGDEPLIDPNQIDQLCQLFSREGVEIGSLAISCSDEDYSNPNRIKLVIDSNGKALYFSRSPIPNREKGNSDYPTLRHIGLYGYRSEVLQRLSQLSETALERTESLEQLRWIFHGWMIHIAMTDIETPNIDVPEDVEKVLDLL